MPWVESPPRRSETASTFFSVAAVAVAIAADVAVVVNDDGDGAYGGPMDKEQLSKGCC